MSEPLQISDKAREVAKQECQERFRDKVIAGGAVIAPALPPGHFVQQLLDEETKPLWEMLERFSYRLKQNRPIVMTDGSHEDFEDCAIQELLTDYHQLLKSKGQTK